LEIGRGGKNGKRTGNGGAKGKKGKRRGGRFGKSGGSQVGIQSGEKIKQGGSEHFTARTAL